jgi:WD40 repeat protein/ABC-type branched-subunit amino acid transport system substrate-binding protein/DNA-binding SARP family transcriptional activator
MLELRLLGSFDVSLDGAPVAIPSRPAQSLLAYLAIGAGTAHRREKLAGLLWPDADESNARSNLRHALWRIRKAIEIDQSAAPYLLTDELAVSVNAGADFWLDVAACSRDGESLQDQIDALIAYRGELLPGFYDDWVTLERERLEALFQHRMQRLLDRLVEERRWSAVLDWGERWVALGHAPEPGYRALMLAHGELANRSAIAAVYQRCREALFNDLGVEPSVATRAVYERLRQDGSQSVSAGPPIVGPSSEDDAPAPGEPPYQGLHCFEESDADRFFGRERLTAGLLGRLGTHSFLTVIGASGSGKSSLLRAGLVPALSRGTQPISDRSSDVYLLTPTARPLEALVSSLVPSTDSAAQAALLADLSRDPHGLRRFLSHLDGTTTRKVLVVDQFEEIFTLCNEGFEREAFVDNLLGASDAPGAPLCVVIALRADFYAHCAEHERLRECVAQHQEYVGPMDASELRRAIERPADKRGCTLEPGLTDLLLRDVGEEPGALPLLSHVLLETWQRRRGRRMTLAGYAAAGGLHGAIAQTAESVFSQRLTLDQQPIARRIFVDLTELGEGTQDTRGRLAIAELARSPAEQQAIPTVLHVLADARLVTLHEESVEVAHEALIRAWPRLREWLNADRQAVRVRRQLLRAAQEWERLGRDLGSLYRGVQLAQALDWAGDHRAELGPLEDAFLVASHETAEQEANEREAQREREIDAARQLAEAEQRRADEQRRAASQLRQRAAFLGVALGVAVIMAGVAVVFGDQARHEARTAVARELSAAALANLNVDPERAALLAVQAAETTLAVDGTSTADAEDALHRVAPLLRAEFRFASGAGRVLAVAFSPDGKRLVTANEDGTASVVDLTTGQLRMVLRGHAAAVNAVAFSPNGNLIATAGDDHTARVWDATSGQQLNILAGHAQEVKRLAFSPDAARLATASTDGTIRLWQLSSGTTVLDVRPEAAGMIGLHPLSGPNGTPSVALAPDVAFGPDGAHLATATPLGQISVLDVSNELPRVLHVWSTVLGSLFPSVAFSPDGSRVAARNDSGVQVWWVGTGQPAVSIVGHANQVVRVAFDPSGSRLATASLDRTAKVWDAGTGRELLTLAGHQDGVSDVGFSPDGQQLATASWDGSVAVWDLGPAREVLTLPTPGIAAWDIDRPQGPQSSQVAWVVNGRGVIAGLKDATASVWDGISGVQLLNLDSRAVSGMVGNAPVPEVWSVATSPDGNRLATAGSDQSVRIWAAASGQLEQTLSGHTGRVVQVAFSSDGSRLVSASLDGTARLWDIATGQVVTIFGAHAGPLTGVAISRDGTRIATSSEGTAETVHLWDPGSGAVLRTVGDQLGTTWSVAFSPDGRRLVTAGQDGTVRTWNATTGESLLVLRGHEGSNVTSVWSPDGKRIASGGRDGTARVWDSSSGRELLMLTGTEPREGVDSVAFSPDGRQLAVRGDQAVRVYMVGIEDLVALVRGRLTRSWTMEECQRFLHLDQCPSGPATIPVGRRPLVAQPPLAHPVTVPPVVPPASTAIATNSGTSPLTGTIKIVSSLPRTGIARAQTDTLVNAFKMALDEHQNRIGDATITYQDMDDGGPNGVWDAATEAGNATRAVNDPDVLAYIGTYNSGAARASIPILCQGNLVMISPANTYPGLTRNVAHNAPNEPDMYYPNCKRNYVRLAATDDLQGANAAAFAKQIGATRALVLHDSDQYGRILADAFAAEAAHLGIDVVIGHEATDAVGGDYLRLANEALRSGADVVYWGGYMDDKGGGLWEALRKTIGGRVTLMGGDGINTPIFLKATGAAAEGTYATFPAVPAFTLTGKGADWYQRYKQQYQSEPDPYAAYAYEAMNVVLAAIERAGSKDRAAIRDSVFATRNYDGILGIWSLTPTGDTTLTMMAESQVVNGRWDERSVQVVRSLP